MRGLALEVRDSLGLYSEYAEEAKAPHVLERNAKQKKTNRRPRAADSRSDAAAAGTHKVSGTGGVVAAVRSVRLETHWG